MSMVRSSMKYMQLPEYIHNAVKAQSLNLSNHAISTKGSRITGHYPGTNIRAFALPISVARPMAPGKNHNRHGETKPVSKLSRLYFADEYARRTVGIPPTAPAPEIEATLDEERKSFRSLKQG